MCSAALTTCVSLAATPLPVRACVCVCVWGWGGWGGVYAQCGINDLRVRRHYHCASAPHLQDPPRPLGAPSCSSSPPGSLQGSSTPKIMCPRLAERAARLMQERTGTRERRSANSLCIDTLAGTYRCQNFWFQRSRAAAFCQSCRSLPDRAVRCMCGSRGHHLHAACRVR